ncbi:hypothetical protein [Candidatus Palauibacter sp.]|uniref:hypothetical protein n=1 Tax=Candidatus Palauibacter sp. TaxID=3101350 RepID=UPI003AF2DDC3
MRENEAPERVERRAATLTTLAVRMDEAQGRCGGGSGSPAEGRGCGDANDLRRNR